jgi:hypothetical protein
MATNLEQVLLWLFQVDTIEDLRALPGLNPDKKKEEAYLLQGINQSKFWDFAKGHPPETDVDTIKGNMVNTHLKALHNFWWQLAKEPALIMFEHDECIFKQFLTTTKSWQAPNGETVLIPKDDGQGVMISAFQSREFSF